MKDIYINSDECLVTSKLFGEDRLISFDMILDKLDSLWDENDNLKEELEDLRESIEQNYRPITREEELL